MWLHGACRTPDTVIEATQQQAEQAPEVKVRWTAAQSTKDARLCHNTCACPAQLIASYSCRRKRVSHVYECIRACVCVRVCVSHRMTLTCPQRTQLHSM